MNCAYLINIIKNEDRKFEIFIVAEKNIAIVFSGFNSAEKGKSQFDLREINKDNYPYFEMPNSQENLFTEGIKLHCNFSPGSFYDIKTVRIRIWDFDEQDWLELED